MATKPSKSINLTLPEGYIVTSTSVTRGTHAVQFLNQTTGDIVRATSTEGLGDALGKAIRIIEARKLAPQKEFV